MMSKLIMFGKGSPVETLSSFGMLIFSSSVSPPSLAPPLLRSNTPNVSAFLVCSVWYSFCCAGLISRVSSAFGAVERRRQSPVGSLRPSLLRSLPFAARSFLPLAR